MNQTMQEIGTTMARDMVPVVPLELGSRKLLTFNVSGETYGLGISAVKEILEYGSVTRIPLMPDFIGGVINLRGSVMPVIDLAARLERPRGEVGRRTCIVIVEVPGEEDTRMDVGVIVDGVNEVLDVGACDIEPAPSFGATIRTDFIAGMARHRDRFVIVLREGRVLSVEELSAFT